MAPNPKLHQNSPELPPIGMVRVAALVPVPALLAEFGHDPEAVLGPFGVTKKLLSDSQNVLPFADTGRVLEHCALVTNVPHFGLLTGDRENLSMLGVLGLIMFNAHTIGEALAALSEHFVLHNRGAVIECKSLDGIGVLRYALLDPHMPGYSHILDLAMVVAVKVLRRLCGPDWTPVEVWLAHERPTNVAPYHALLGPAVRFNAAETAVMFDAHCLDQPIANADPVVHQFMTTHANEIEVTSDGDLIDQIERLMPFLMMARRATTTELSKVLGCSERTLRRRLSARGTGFTKLREAAAFGVAQQLLANSAIPITDLSDQLGFANPSAFSRAFARWSGMPPRQWRSCHRR